MWTRIRPSTSKTIVTVLNEQFFFTNIKNIAEAIVAMFGGCCEVAVHDLRDPSCSLVHLAGNVTGRQIGAPATDLLIRNLRRDPESVTDIHNYKTTARDGRCIKSTTVFCKNESGRIFAAFCINFDTTEVFNATQILNNFISTAISETSHRETFAVSAGETIEALFDHTLMEIGKQPATMTAAERINLVTRLYEQNVFQMKGAVKEVARLSGVSAHTIYNHLKFVRQQNEKPPTAANTGERNEKAHKN